MVSIVSLALMRASIGLRHRGIRTFASHAAVRAIPSYAGRSLTLRLFSSNENNELPPRTHNAMAQTYTRGQEISAVVTQFGPLGASVTVNGGDAYGLILQSEIHLYRDKHGTDVSIGDTLDAYVERVREDGKLHVFLRPVDKARLGSVGEQIMEALEMSPDEVIPIGDKSSPEDIGAYFYGVSKRDFKNAVGTLYREGRARPGPFSTELISEEDREEFLAEQAKKREEYTNNKGSGFQGNENQDRTIFVGNLPFSTNQKILENTVIKVLGPDRHANIRLATDIDGRCRGFGYVELKEKSDVSSALESLRGVEVMGRKVRTDYSVKETKLVEFLDSGKGVGETSFSERSPRRGSEGRSRRRPPAASLFLHNLSFQASEAEVLGFIRSCPGLDANAVGDIRMGIDKETGRSRGFCHVDFYREEAAKLIYERMHEKELLGRRVHIDEARRKNG